MSFGCSNRLTAANFRVFLALPCFTLVTNIEIVVSYVPYGQNQVSRTSIFRVLHRHAVVRLMIRGNYVTLYRIITMASPLLLLSAPETFHARSAFLRT
jgi:hypothetical protein